MKFKNIKNLIEKIYYQYFPNYIKELAKALSDCQSVIDLGCGSNSPIKIVKKLFPHKFYSLGIDIHQPSLIESKKQKIHDRYYQMDVMDIGKHFGNKSFDCVLASDLSEHLKKSDGLKLIKLMEKIAAKKIIILTPNGFLAQKNAYGNPWQTHRSGYQIKEMQNLGFEVFGINGWKKLKGVRYYVTLRPKYFWLFIATCSQPFVRLNPQKAFSLFCIKNIAKKVKK